MRSRSKTAWPRSKSKVIWIVAPLLFSLSTNVAADPANRSLGEVLCPTEFAKLKWPNAIKKKRATLAGKILYLPRLREAAIVLNVGLDSPARLPELAEKTYIYVIDNQNRLALIERVLDPGAAAMEKSGAQFLGSHEGLYRLLQSQSPNGSIEVLGAGEVVIRNGRVFSVSNGSGTFRGRTENLEFAMEKLKRAGLKVDDRTEVRNYATNKYKDPHDVEGVAAVEARQQLQQPRFFGLMEETRRIMKLVDTKFRNPYEDFYLPAVRSIEDQDLKDSYRAASELLTRWRTADEDDWLTVYVAVQRNPEEYRRALRVLEERAARPESEN